MNIFKQFFKSIYDINWLRERRNNKKEAIGYFFFLPFIIDDLLEFIKLNNPT